MSRRAVSFALALMLTLLCNAAEPVRFAFMTDLHLSEGSPRFEQLQFCIDRINSTGDVDFVLIGGDITDFGSDSEIAAAKKALDNLSMPCYVVAGNHDAKWSESGCNTFAKVFGYEHFEFEKGGVKFLGCNCGPNMRMAPAMVPHESLVWLDSVMTHTPTETPVVFLNHYPQDTMSLNYFKVTNSLKKGNIQMLIGGHRHTRFTGRCDSIPYMLGCSLEKRGADGLMRTNYYIFDIRDGRITSTEHRFIRKDGGFEAEEPETFFSLNLSRRPQFTPAAGCDERYFLPADFPWLTYDVNLQYPQVRTVWEIQNSNDVGCGAVQAGKYVLYADESGYIKALDASTGREKWSFATEGKIFSTPAVSDGRVVIGSTDGYIYCLKLRSGRLMWRVKCGKSVLATPAILDGTAYCGASDGIFRAIDIKSGLIRWHYDEVKGFVECRPYVDRDQVVFGDWANTLYSLDPRSGALQWSWYKSGSRMYSPAAVNPVKHNGRIYISTPRRLTYCFDASSGKELWNATGGRENASLSPDGTRLYVKAMFGTMRAYDLSRTDPATDAAALLWEVSSDAQYDISPTPCAATESLVFVPTDKGNIICKNASDGETLWIHKVSTGLINSIVPLEGGRLLVSTMDGIITLLEY